MRKNKMVFKLIGALLFCMLVVLAGATGCTNDEKIDNQKQSYEATKKSDESRSVKLQQGQGTRIQLRYTPDQLVEKEIISQEQAEKWIKYQEQKNEEMQAEMENVQNMSQDERKEYMAKNRNNRQNILEELVDAEIITTEQAEVIKEEMIQKTKIND